MKTIILILFIVVLPATGLSFSRNPVDSATVESVLLVSHGKNVPFWLLSNRYGIIDNTPFNGLIRASAYGGTSKHKKVGIDYGLDLYNRYSDHYKAILHQAWLGVRFSEFEIRGGKWEKFYGNQDSLLSSGGILWSGNAPVMPSVELRTKGFINIPFTHGYLNFKAGIAHSWMGENHYSSGVLLHHKYLYLRTTDKFPVTISAGLHHFAQWGGTVKDSTIGHLPSDLSAFWNVFLANSGTDDSPLNEQLNALGNHLGSYNIRVDVRVAGLKTAVYWQSIFEDNSGRKLRNMPDGLWGFSLRRQTRDWLPSHFTFEYLHTLDQSGPVTEPANNGHFPTGNDSYFNNGIYKDGWSIEGRSIGTPLISSPLYFGANTHFYNNRVRAYHFGLRGQSPNDRFSYIFFYTFSENFGTYNNPFDKPQNQHDLLLGIGINNFIGNYNNLLFNIATSFGIFRGSNTGIQIRFIHELI